MATERIEIENYKGIKKLELDVRPFTVLTGPQSVGKSTTAKLLFFFKKMAQEAFIAANADAETSLETHLIRRFWDFMPPPTRESGKSSIRYFVGDSVFSLTSENGDSDWRIELPKAFQDEIASLDLNLDYYQILATKPGSRFVSWPLFIPAGRSFYAQIEKDPFSFFENAALDPFVAGFGKLLARLKYDFPRFQMESNGASPALVQHADELVEHLLGGRYQREGQKDLIIVAKGQRIPVSHWSSGQQEVLPLVLFLLLFFRGTHAKTNLFVEEPEAHLFPTSQRNMVELLALAFNAKPERLNLFITTHSPYVLSMLNVLLLAGQLAPGKLNGGNNGGGVHPLEVLAANSFGAYYMDQNECHSIIDAETGLIDGRGIDDVSGEIAEQFDAISHLQ